jgi:crossover junction endodeoxyribonuclease RusA
VATKELRLSLLWPPSVNHYWGHGRGRTYITANGKAYRENVFADVMEAGAPRVTKGSRLAVTIEAYPPNQRKCDIDNLQKAIFDSLTAAMVWEDDEQVDDLHVIRCPVLPPGKVVVRIRELRFGWYGIKLGQ